jgi:hypothetical protein
VQLGQRNAAAAATAATVEMGPRLVRISRGEDVILASVGPGPAQPILVVKPDATIVRGVADIKKRILLDPDNTFRTVEHR